MPADFDIRDPDDLAPHISCEQQFDFMRTLVDSTVDAIIVHEPGGQLVFYNQGALNLIGLTAQEMETLPPYGWVGSESKSNAPGRLESILHDGRKKFMSSVVHASGETIPTEVIASRFNTDRGPLVVAVIRDAREQAEVAEKLEYLAYHDALTGLANRHAFENRLTVAIADAVRYGDLLMLAYLDLDRFKPVNDRYGHEAGDAVLIEVGKRLILSVRVQDLVARLGGDEFVVLLQRVESQDEIAGIADRLLASMRQPIDIGGLSVQIDASVGFAIFDPAVDDARTLVVKADTAMYESKRDDTHAWLVYAEHMGSVEARLRQEAPPAASDAE
jgi:diguanylate cyclase (GGDEF)-like protein/PAS domain S-box-containing protein